MPRAPGKRVAAACGIGAAAVVALGLLSWREIETRHHLHMLRRDPGYLAAAIEGGPGSRRWEAAKRYARTQEGRPRVLHLYLHAIGRERKELGSDLESIRADVMEPVLLLGALRGRDGGPGKRWFLEKYRFEGRRLYCRSWELVPEEQDHRPALDDLVQEGGYDAFEMEDLPGLTFSVLGRDRMPSGYDHACLFTRKGSDMDRIIFREKEGR